MNDETDMNFLIDFAARDRADDELMRLRRVLRSAVNSEPVPSGLRERLSRMIREDAA